jgi:TIR domain
MPYSPEREALHTELLTAIYANFREDAEWPRLRVIELQLDELLNPAGGITEVLQEIGQDFVSWGPPQSDTSVCTLRLRGVARARGSEDDCDRIVSLARAAATAYWTAGGHRPANISLADLPELASAWRDEALRKRLLALANLAEWLTQVDSQGHYTATRSTMRLRDVNDIGDLFERLDAHGRRLESEFGRKAPVGVRVQPKRLFISHAAADGVLAQALEHHLQLALPGTGIFVASRLGAIAAGAPWLQVIQRQLKESDTYLVLLTPTSIRRQWVWFESGAAWFSDQRVIPLVYGMPKDQVKPPLSAHQALDLRDEAEAKQLWIELGTELADYSALEAELAMVRLPLETDGLIDPA